MQRICKQNWQWASTKDKFLSWFDIALFLCPKEAKKYKKYNNDEIQTTDFKLRQYTFNTEKIKKIKDRDLLLLNGFVECYLFILLYCRNLSLFPGAEAFPKTGEKILADFLFYLSQNRGVCDDIKIEIEFKRYDDKLEIRRISEISNGQYNISFEKSLVFSSVINRSSVHTHSYYIYDICSMGKEKNNSIYTISSDCINYFYILNETDIDFLFNAYNLIGKLPITQDLKERNYYTEDSNFRVIMMDLFDYWASQSQYYNESTKKLWTDLNFNDTEFLQSYKDGLIRGWAVQKLKGKKPTLNNCPLYDKGRKSTIDMVTDVILNVFPIGCCEESNSFKKYYDKAEKIVDLIFEKEGEMHHTDCDTTFCDSTFGWNTSSVSTWNENPTKEELTESEKDSKITETIPAEQITRGLMPDEVATASQVINKTISIPVKSIPVNVSSINDTKITIPSYNLTDKIVYNRDTGTLEVYIGDNEPETIEFNGDKFNINNIDQNELIENKENKENKEGEKIMDNTTSNNMPTFNIFGQNIEFGIIQDPNIASTIMGVAVKKNNSWRIFNKDKKTITDLGGIQIGNFPIMVIPCTKLSVGDLIRENGEYYYVISFNDGITKVLNTSTGEYKEIAPVHNIFGINFYSRLHTFESDFTSFINSKGEKSGLQTIIKMGMLSNMFGQQNGFNLDSMFSTNKTIDNTNNTNSMDMNNLFSMIMLSKFIDAEDIFSGVLDSFNSTTAEEAEEMEEETDEFEYIYDGTGSARKTKTTKTTPKTENKENNNIMNLLMVSILFSAMSGNNNNNNNNNNFMQNLIMPMMLFKAIGKNSDFGNLLPF